MLSRSKRSEPKSLEVFLRTQERALWMGALATYSLRVRTRQITFSYFLTSQFRGTEDFGWDADKHGLADLFEVMSPN